eukprot:gene7931-8750_t
MNRLVRNQLRQAQTLCKSVISSSVVARPAAASLNLLVAKRDFSKHKENKPLPLAEIVANEIDYEEKNTEVDPELADLVKQVEKTFHVATKEGEAMVTLTRTFKDEHITIKFDTQNTNDDLPTDDNVFENEEEMDEEGEEQEEEMENNFGIDFEVTIVKGDTKLAAMATATETDSIIQSVRFLPKDEENGNMEIYGGPNLGDLDEQLQQGLSRFFEKRGIDRELAVFIVAYSREKEQKEYVRWLKNLHSFIR